MKHAERVLVMPFSDAMGGLTAEEIHEQHVTPYFMGADGESPPYRPVQEGDLIRLRHGAQIVECKVVETEPPKRCAPTSHPSSMSGVGCVAMGNARC